MPVHFQLKTHRTPASANAGRMQTDEPTPIFDLMDPVGSPGSPTSPETPPTSPNAYEQKPGNLLSSYGGTGGGMRKSCSVPASLHALGGGSRSNLSLLARSRPMVKRRSITGSVDKEHIPVMSPANSPALGPQPAIFPGTAASLQSMLQCTAKQESRVASERMPQKSLSTSRSSGNLHSGSGGLPSSTSCNSVTSVGSEPLADPMRPFPSSGSLGSMASVGSETDLTEWDQSGTCRNSNSTTAATTETKAKVHPFHQMCPFCARTRT